MNWIELDINNNGLLPAFQAAQSNLTINQANKIGNFADNGLPGQVPTPLFDKLFAGLPAASGYANSAFITDLQQADRRDVQHRFDQHPPLGDVSRQHSHELPAELFCGKSVGEQRVSDQQCQLVEVQRTRNRAEAPLLTNGFRALRELHLQQSPNRYHIRGEPGRDPELSIARKHRTRQVPRLSM